MTATRTPLQSLAAAVRKEFIRDTRDNGDRCWKRETHAEDWISDLCRDALGDVPPDDWGYTSIVDALNALAEHEDVDNAREWLFADINMAENFRAALEYAADALGADSADIGDCLQRGLPEERCEVFESVLASLEAHLQRNR